MTSWLRLLAGLCVSAAAYAQCEASPQIKSALDSYASATRFDKPQAERKAGGAAAIDRPLAENPTDYFLLDRKRDLLDDNTSDGYDRSVAWFAAAHEKYLDSPAVTTVYADVLRNKDSARALALLEGNLKEHPDFPWTHFKLIGVFESGKQRDPERAMQEAEAFMKLCPNYSNAYIYRIVLTSGTTAQIAHYALMLRERLSADSGEPNQGLWGVLWDLEFKAVPPAEHPAVRERISNDLATLSEWPHEEQASFLTFLRRGYSNIGDKTAVDRIDRQVVADFPKSREAEDVTKEQWRRAHPYPKDGDHAAVQAWNRLHVAAAHEWYARWGDVISLMEEFNSTAALDNTKGENLLKLGEKYVAAYQSNSNSFYGALPVEFEVADALIKHKALPSTVPAWIDEGYRRETNRPSRLLGRARDEMTDEMKARADQQLDAMRIARARVLLAYYDATGERSKAAGIDDGLSGINPKDDRMKPELYEVRAKTAEMQGHQLDALIFYQAARAMRGSGRGMPGAASPAELDAKVMALFKELGGTYAGLPLFTGKKLEPVSEVRWEQPKNPLPAFSLSDLGGKTWKLADLNGKATLINVWATWCGPCRAEHPEFQKLYDKLKNRPDVAIFTLNVDEEAGLVEPYMKENHYTFPVLFGKDLLQSVSGEGGVSIPQNWFVSPAAKLSFLQLGYGGDPTWESTIIGKLDEMLKQK